MESPEGIPSLNLDDIASDKQERTGNESTMSHGGAKGVGAPNEKARGREDRQSEVEDSKRSFELLDTSKDDESGKLSSVSSSYLGVSTDRKLKRRRPDRTDTSGSNTPANGLTPPPDTLRSTSREIIAPDMDKHLPQPDNESEEAKHKRQDMVSDGYLESAVTDAVMAENKKLKEVLLRERRHHAREKTQIRQVLYAIDDALSTLPRRLGKIRIQNQKNLTKINTLPIEYRDRGDFEIILEGCPKYLESSSMQDEEQEDEEEDGHSRQLSLAKRESLQFSQGVHSDISNATSTTLIKKIESLNNLMEEIKKGQSAPIEVILNNELCAISLLKNEIKCTKKKIERKSKTDSDSVIVANWEADNIEAPSPKSWNPEQRIDNKDIQKLERYVWLQKEAISVLSMEVKKTKDMFVNEMKAKEQAQSEKMALMKELMRLRNPAKIGEDSQRPRCHVSDGNSAARPFRTIRELKGQLEQKERVLANCKAKISRLEAATSNKGILLDNERKKNEELEAKVKILSVENKSLSKQIGSLQYINQEMKEQMDVLKGQIDILISQNSESSPQNSAFDLKKSFTELAETLKKEDARVRAVQEEAEKKMSEMESRHMTDMDRIRSSFERAEKMNFEYMRTLKALLISLHSYHMNTCPQSRTRNSYGRVKEILGITEVELESLLSGNLQEKRENELEELYEQCSSFVNNDEHCEFSLKLSAWLFDLIKQKMTYQNFDDIM